MNCNEGKTPLSLLENKDDKSMLEFQWTHSWKVNWQNTVIDPSGGIMRTSGDTPMKVSITNPTVKISVSEPKQVISFENKAKVVINGPEQETGWLKIVEAVFGGSVRAGEVIEENVNKMLPKIDIQFKGVNVFAASNLLFPSDHVITYDSNGVFVPGDLVIFGTTKSKL
ncbi:MAG: hypothetical protein A4E51_00912 [Methanosaeta sp. PtaU1.Bin055]|nr:MAG: hypothetical protein A4E51_00912 [Methanosaeta sp. PtaU1.Bin055]